MRPAQKAFTLVELLIVVSIITIISGSMLPSFNNYINTQNVKQSQEQVKDDLRSLENRALNGELASTEISGSKVNYWVVEFPSGSRYYNYYLSLDNDVCGSGSDWTFIKAGNYLPGENVLRSSTRCLFFSFDNSDVNSPGFSSPISVIVGPETGSGVCKRIQITSNGMIQYSASTSCT